MKAPKLIGWAACAAEIRALRARVAELERDSHPPIDLGPAIEEALAARGYAPTVQPAEATDA